MNKAKPGARRSNEAQIDKFRDLARELECDEDEEAFRAKFRKVATAPKPTAKAADSK